jgi:tricorn protease
MNSGYYRVPNLHDREVIFVCEDDIWLTDLNGKMSRRLTSNLGEITTPYFSPDGKWIAFVGREEGNPEIYVMPSSGGMEKRLTYLGSTVCLVAGWHDDRIVFASNNAQPFKRITELWEIKMDGNDLQKLPYGYARNISFGKNGVVIGRNTADPATWKRYKGGRAGEIWIDRSGDGKFVKLIDLKSNLANPMWIENRIYFISDHDGIGNIYSCLPDGSDLKKHTNHADFYVRNASTDGKNIIYHSGGNLYILDVKKDIISQIPIEYEGPRIQTNRKFVDTEKYLEDCALSFDGKFLTLNSRGKSVSFANWEGAVLYHGKNGVRYRLSRWLPDGKNIVTASDDENEDHIEVVNLDDPQNPKKIEIETGRPVEIKVSPKSNEIVLSNNRNELIWIDLESSKSKVIDRNAYFVIDGFNWSSDGRWISYACNINRTQSIIKIYDTKSGEIHEITKPVLKDMMPVFDPLGRYLYILSLRVFNPIYDKMKFDLGFPRGMKPYLITLRKDLPSPFVPKPRGFKLKDKKEDEEIGEVVIDFDGIKDRIVPFPVTEGIYSNIGSTKDKIFYTTLPVEGAIVDDIFSSELPANATLKYFDLEDLEEKTFLDHVSNFKISEDGSAIIVRIKNSIRILSTSKEVPKEESGKKGGWIDLTRIKISIDPILEWQQMLKEAWRLQKDYFWREDMSGVDWKRILDKYYPLVERISSRSEFSDLIWEMQGELGTSHAYELGGDYRPRPEYRMGFLGADLTYDPEKHTYKIFHVIGGDPWSEYAPPLKRPGTDAKVGDLLIAVNGQKLSKEFSPEMALVNMANQEVQLKIKSGEEIRELSVKVIPDDTPLRYREWVEKNRRYVYEGTNNRVGYIHIPDMMAVGYAEFHRSFLAELDKEGLIVDVRFNSGGEVSQLLLEKLARKRIGYDLTRWMGAQPYPTDSPYGPVVALTNEYAGSDGDIFSHAFKLMKIGKLIGRRTWGGVIGIWPRAWLVDGTITTQPEMSFWFKDVGWGVENYGTDPDIEVDMKPQDHAAEKDPQLDRAIEEIMKEITDHSPLKPFSEEKE